MTDIIAAITDIGILKFVGAILIVGMFFYAIFGVGNKGRDDSQGSNTPGGGGGNGTIH